LLGRRPVADGTHRVVAALRGAAGTVGEVSDNPTRPTAVTPGDGPRPAADRLGDEPRWNPPPAPRGAGDDPTRADRPAGAGGPLQRGTTLAGRYRLEEPLATGGMATVWRATDAVLTRPVAVKVLHAHLAADPEFVARFRREAVAAARLAHPAIVAIYDTCDDPEAIVMELVEGHTLREELDERGFLPPGEALSIASSICQALDVAHKAGIVHRDVKPANVLLSRGGQLKVADFGIAKAARAGDGDGDGHDDLPDLTTIGRMVGTAKYLAPEQVSGGDIDARTDVYAVGAVLYEMLCGRAPFSGDNDLAVATARLHGPPPRPRSVLRTVPPRLDDVVMKALSVDPEQRQPSASALWADLQSCPTDDLPAAPRPSDATAVGDAPSFARSERSWLVPALLVSLIAGALGLAWVLIGGTEVRDDLFGVFDRDSERGGAADADEPLALATPTAFDPEGEPRGIEHNDEAPLAVDGDVGTGWTTETYRSRQDFLGLKDGVGLWVDLGEDRDVGQVVVTSPGEEWSATVHVADEPGEDIGAWGSAVGSIEAADPGETTIDLADASGRYLLVWITDLGASSFELQELQVRAA
jgi:serine/threonine-protein kinase